MEEYRECRRCGDELAEHDCVMCEECLSELEEQFFTPVKQSCTHENTVEVGDEEHSEIYCVYEGIMV